jgi:hypothetical protein
MLSVGARSHRFSPSQNVFIAVVSRRQPTVRQEASDQLAMIGLGRTPPSECSRARRSRAKSFVIRLDARLPFGAVLHARVAFFAKLRIPNRANGWREDRAHVVLHPLPTQGGSASRVCNTALKRARMVRAAAPFTTAVDELRGHTIVCPIQSSIVRDPCCHRLSAAAMPMDGSRTECLRGGPDRRSAADRRRPSFRGRPFRGRRRFTNLCTGRAKRNQRQLKLFTSDHM